jgi:hypothetical protein
VMLDVVRDGLLEIGHVGDVSDDANPLLFDGEDADLDFTSGLRFT